MSILIKGVDMPTTPKVYRCELTIYFDDGVGKFSHCHRVPPEDVVFIKPPHGYLIDANRLVRELNESVIEGSLQLSDSEVFSTIASQPTVIESEE